MKLVYSINNPDSGSPFNLKKGWKGWTLEMENDCRIQIECDDPDNSTIGCHAKGALDIDIVDGLLLETDSPYILHKKFPIYELWIFNIDNPNMKTILFCMLDLLFSMSGATEGDFKEYAHYYHKPDENKQE